MPIWRTLLYDNWSFHLRTTFTYQEYSQDEVIKQQWEFCWTFKIACFRFVELAMPFYSSTISVKLEHSIPTARCQKQRGTFFPSLGAQQVNTSIMSVLHGHIKIHRGCLKSCYHGNFTSNQGSWQKLLVSEKEKWCQIMFYQTSSLRLADRVKKWLRWSFAAGGQKNLSSTVGPVQNIFK